MNIKLRFVLFGPFLLLIAGLGLAQLFRFRAASPDRLETPSLSVRAVQQEPQVLPRVLPEFPSIRLQPAEDENEDSRVGSLGVELSGRIVDLEGHPIADAEVVVGRWTLITSINSGFFSDLGPPTKPWIDSDTVQRSRSEVDGSFRFDTRDDPRERDGFLIAMAPGRVPLVIADLAYGRTAVQGLELDLEPATPLELFLRDSLTDAPIPGARVVLISDDQNPVQEMLEQIQAREAKSDAAGRVVFDQLPTRPFRLWIVAAGYAQDGYTDDLMGPAPIQIRLRSGARIVGRVIDGTSGLELDSWNLSAESCTSDYGLLSHIVLRDDEAARAWTFVRGQDVPVSPGLFAVFDYGMGDLNLDFARKGSATGRYRLAELAPGGCVELQLVALRESVIEGRVRSRDGELVVGAEVTATRGNGEHFGKSASTESARPMPQFHPAERVLATTDAEGRFSLLGLSLGTYTIRASHPAFLCSEPRVVELISGDSGHECDFDLAPRAAVEREER